MRYYWYHVFSCIIMYYHVLSCIVVMYYLLNPKFPNSHYTNCHLSRWCKMSLPKNREYTKMAQLWRGEPRNTVGFGFFFGYNYLDDPRLIVGASWRLIVPKLMTRRVEGIQTSGCHPWAVDDAMILPKFLKKWALELGICSRLHLFPAKSRCGYGLRTVMYL